jgi:hypothetical protein
MNCGSPKGIAIAPTTLIAAITATTGLSDIENSFAAISIKHC